jgi:hypothetical protein
MVIGSGTDLALGFAIIMENSVKYWFLTFLLLGAVACAPASRENADDGSYWLLRDGRAQMCIQNLRYRGIIGVSQPVMLYSDSVNIVTIRQSNPTVFAATETEFKNLCASIGISFEPTLDEDTSK